MTDWVWGIDPGIARVAAAFAGPGDDELDVDSALVGVLERDGARLATLAAVVRASARGWAAEFPPACVWVEQPSGKGRNLQLAYAVGVIQAALAECLEVPVWTIPAAKWKAATVRNGSASKRDVAAWIAEFDVDTRNQDEVDALAIALAGRAIFRARRWEMQVERSD
jgi:Holliday junction resolvasome RuvABC endonuclease subunit